MHFTFAVKHLTHQVSNFGIITEKFKVVDSVEEME